MYTKNKRSNAKRGDRIALKFASCARDENVPAKQAHFLIYSTDYVK